MLDNTLRSHFDVLYRRQRLFGKSPETVRLHLLAIRQFGQFLGREPMLTDLDNDRLIDLMSWCVQRGRANATANRNRECLVALWEFLARKRIVDLFPDVPRLPEAQADPVAWLKPELHQLWQACVDAPGTIGDMQAAPWWLVCHSLLWDSADRIGPILKADWRAFALSTGWATFPASDRKGRRKSNTFRLHADTILLLRRIERPSGPVLPFPYTYTYLWRLYARLLARAGLPHDRMHKFHAMRRSAGSWIQAAGGDATLALGHTREETTRRHYIDPRVTGNPKPADVLFRPGDPEPPRAA